MGGGGKGSSDQETSQTVEPWGPQQQPLIDLYSQAAGLPQQQPYPHPGVVPWSPESVGAMSATSSRAMQGSPNLASAQAENLRTTSGQYLDPQSNPFFQRAFDASRRQLTPQLQGSSMLAGRYGSGLAQSNELQTLGDAWSDQWAGMYGAERDRMLRGSAMGPALAQADYYDMDRLAGVGAMKEGKAQDALTDVMTRWGGQQQAPYDQLGMQSNVIQGGNFGGATEGTQAPQESGTNPLGAAAGGAAMGFSVGGPWGAAAGGALGLMSAMK